jgi:hypothetical protein
MTESSPPLFGGAGFRFSFAISSAARRSSVLLLTLPIGSPNMLEERGVVAC